MANEFIKPPSIKPAITGAIADPDEYNQNIAGQSKDSVTFIDQDGLFVDGNVGDETIGATGSLITHQKFRQGGAIAFYDSNGIQQSSVATSNLNNIVQATTSLRGTAEIATQAEADAGTDATRIITPSTLANFPFPDGIKLNQILTFTSSGTYSKHADLSFVIVELVGGGGGGAGAAGNQTSGGTSSFGGVVSATGGSAGASSLFATPGVGVSGDLNIQGGVNKHHSNLNYKEGGNSFFGNGGINTDGAPTSSGFLFFSPSVGGGGAGGTSGLTILIGGSGGGYARKVIQASSLSSSVSVTVGGGGTGGATTGGGQIGGQSGASGIVIIHEFIVV